MRETSAGSSRRRGMPHWLKRIASADLVAVVCAALAAGCGGGSGGGAGVPPPVSAPTPPPSSSPPPPPPPPPPAPPQFVTPFQSMDLLHTDLVFDSARTLIYAYVPPASPQNPSTITVIDPRARSLVSSTRVDFVPWHMTVSPDGRYLYVSSLLPRKVVRLALPAMTIDLEVDLGKPTWIPAFLPEYDLTMFPGSVAVDPQDSSRFAVSLLSSTYPLNKGLRVYRNATALAEVRSDVNSRFGDILAFEAPDRLVTAVSGTTPDTVTRLRIDGTQIVEVESLRVGGSQTGGSSASIGLSSGAYLTAGGSKVELPGFTYRGQLPPLASFLQGDPAPLIKGCVFANDQGTVAACLSHWDYDVRLPTFRVFALYELTDANPFSVIGLDQTISGASEIIRYGAGEFAVSVWMDRPYSGVEIETGQFLAQNRRIYFFTGIDTVYRP